MDAPSGAAPLRVWIAAAIIAVEFIASCRAADRQYWYTAPTVGPDNVFTGNRILAPDARGGFPDVDSFDVDLPSDVEWIVATDANSGPQFVVTTRDGPAYAVTNTGDVKQIDYGAESCRPPVVVTTPDGSIEIVELPPAAKLSSLSHPVPVFPCSGEQTDDSCEVYAYIDTRGDIVLYDNLRQQKLDQICNVNALPDARIVKAPTNAFDATNGATLLAAYAGAVDYSHCVLGDCLEGSSLLLIRVSRAGDNSYSMTLERQIILPAGDVFEGMAPMFIKDGAEIVTTVASSLTGAWLRVYGVFCGDIVSESSSIGWGWRHVLFYNNFALIESNGDPLYSLVDVLTPHVRKRLQFFDIDAGSAMEMRASADRYTTHDIGWRYLDTAVSGDFNGDGINEALLLDEYLQNLVSFQLASDGSSVEEVWSTPLGGKLSSNLAAVAYGDGTQRRIALAAATGNQLRVWMSPSPSPVEYGDATTSTSAATVEATTTSATTTTASNVLTTTATPVQTSSATIGTSTSATSTPVETTATFSTAVILTTSASTSAASTTTSITTSAGGTSSMEVPAPASNDDVGMVASNAEPRSCSAQSKLAAGLRLSIAFACLLPHSWH